ncbi:hypothetical protein PAECIP111893_03971 [Paenibacillus plantiphilus]|uniref:ABC transporter permease n=1 Tax=Paenibacillus plantiphilus TaxID=2905650 RepID=A0ABN8GWI1_9BACL|nr:hypothetical protein [Paenibacillus plantiphilus]CAH1215441.1 hypothetical protein PAECIP111893_03971 [Paenibacillus plantiphilus]
MSSLPNYYSIAGNQIRRWFTNPRIYILVALLIILMWTYIGPIIQFSHASGYRVSSWLFPFLSNFAYTQMFMLFGVVLLFCDAPFVNEGQPYLLIRSGRIHWALGQILYISLSTAIYCLFIAAVSMLLLIPNMFVSPEWGKVLRTLAQTNAGQEFNVRLPISFNLQSSYTPIQAISLSLLLEWCVGMIIGLVIFIMNTFFKRAIGAIIGAAIILFDFAIFNNLSHYFYNFSPVSMARLTILDPSGLSLRPTPMYAIVFLFSSIIVLSIIAVLSVRKRDIEISPQI